MGNKKKYFLEIMLTYIEEILVVCSSSMVFLLLEYLQLKILLALYRQLCTFPSAILLKKDVLNFYAHENKVLSSHLLFSFVILTDLKLSGKLHHHHRVLFVTPPIKHIQDKKGLSYKIPLGL